MSNRVRIPTEQVETRALVNAILDYLFLRHGAIIEIIVSDWSRKRSKRLEGLRKTQEES